MEWWRRVVQRLEEKEPEHQKQEGSLTELKSKRLDHDRTVGLQQQAADIHSCRRSGSMGLGSSRDPGS